MRRALEHYLRGGLQAAAPCRESVEHGHAQVPAEGEYERDKVGRLREEAEMLERQLDEVMTRLEAMGQES